jgi:hypothetical protein
VTGHCESLEAEFSINVDYLLFIETNISIEMLKRFQDQFLILYFRQPCYQGDYTLAHRRHWAACTR